MASHGMPSRNWFAPSRQGRSKRTHLPLAWPLSARSCSIAATTVLSSLDGSSWLPVHETGGSGPPKEISREDAEHPRREAGTLFRLGERHDDQRPVLRHLVQVAQQLDLVVVLLEDVRLQ